MLNTLPVPATQVAHSRLFDLAAKVRETHTGVITAFSDVIKYAIDCGEALLIAKELVPHGQWGKFLKRCDVGERQAERYMCLARLVKANPTSKSDLVGLTIEKAIKKLAPSKAKERRLNAKTVAASEAIQTTHLDIVAAWMPAPVEERTKAINHIGLKPLFAALPQDWLPQVEQLIAERQQSCTAVVPAIPAEVSDDLSIPGFLRRETVEDDAGGILDEPHSDEDDDELELKPRRKLKLIECKTILAEAVTDAFEALGELAFECREIADNAPENLQATERIQAFENSATELEDLEAPDVPDSVGALTLKYSIPKRRYLSRQSRANDAVTMLEACLKALADHATAQELGSELQNVIAAASGCEFPGMYD